MVHVKLNVSGNQNCSENTIFCETVAVFRNDFVNYHAFVKPIEDDRCPTLIFMWFIVLCTILYT